MVSHHALSYHAEGGGEGEAKECERGTKKGEEEEDLSVEDRYTGV